MKNIKSIFLMLAVAMTSYVSVEAYPIKKGTPAQEAEKSHKLEEDAWEDMPDMY